MATSVVNKSELQKSLNKTLKAAAIMLPSQILNIGRDIPPVNAFSPESYVRRGFLMRLQVTHFGQQKKWLRRFCILTPSKLFIYQHEKSFGYEKATECLDLSKYVRCQRTASKYGDYFEFTLYHKGEDSSTSGSASLSSRFFSSSSGKSRKYICFGATELTEAEDWILSIQKVLSHIHDRLYEDGSIYGFRNYAHQKTKSVAINQQQQQLLANTGVLPKSCRIRRDHQALYTYSSEEEESNNESSTNASSLNGSFGGPAVANEALTILLTPRSVRSSESVIIKSKQRGSEMKKQAASQRYHHSSGDEESLKDFNEIKTLQEDERRSKSFIHQPSVISDSTTPSTSICVTEVPSPAREDLMLEMNKLRSLCSNIELDFNSAKNDLSHLQETVMNLQKACDNVDGKMEKFANQMKCMERQQAIMLNDLRIKSEILDRKISEVEELKLDLRISSTSQRITQTLPKQHNGGGGQQRSKRKPSLVQICQDPGHQERTAAAAKSSSKCDKRLSLMGPAASQ